MEITLGPTVRFRDECVQAVDERVGTSTLLGQMRGRLLQDWDELCQKVLLDPIHGQLLLQDQVILRHALCGSLRIRTFPADELLPSSLECWSEGQGQLLPVLWSAGDVMFVWGCTIERTLPLFVRAPGS